MIQNDDDLKRLYREHVRGRAPEGRDVCPDPEILAMIATPGAHVGNREKLLDHIGGCPECSRELRLLLGIQKESESLSKRLAPPPLFFKAAWAFFGLAVTIASLYLLMQRPFPRIDLRSGKPSIVIVSPCGDSGSTKPILFEWHLTPEADYYVLEIFDEALLPVWTSPPVPGRRLLLPEGPARKLSPDKPYYWMVSAFSQKEKLAESGLVHFVFRD